MVWQTNSYLKDSLWHLMVSNLAISDRNVRMYIYEADCTQQEILEFFLNSKNVNSELMSKIRLLSG